MFCVTALVFSRNSNAAACCTANQSHNISLSKVSVHIVHRWVDLHLMCMCLVRLRVTGVWSRIPEVQVSVRSRVGVSLLRETLT